ncbi:pentapeptide repeat-containing protein [Halovenus amylolytica]|uniref:pentapeptide repeat-containing protein n=1 Tax=Halovenus amylolytica TaxID=2500550 RepID=UPI00361AC5BB
MSTGTCTYVLDPDDPETWDGTEDDTCYVQERKLTADGVWRCPHEPRQGEKRCPFHLPVERKSDGAVVDAFLDAVANTSNGDLELLGARFGAFELPADRRSVERTVGGIDLSHATFAGPFDWSNASLDAEYLYLLGARFDAAATFSDSELETHAGFLGATFGSRTRFDGVLAREADFRSVRFDREVSFEGARIEGRTSFERSKFTGLASFEDVRVDGGADFRGATFTDAVDFHNGRFGGEATFASARFGGGADFSDAEFDGDATFVRTEFNSDVTFESVRFRRDADFTGMKATGDAVFTDVVVDGERSFQFAEIGDIDRSGIR